MRFGDVCGKKVSTLGKIPEGIPSLIPAFTLYLVEAEGVNAPLVRQSRQVAIGPPIASNMSDTTGRRLC
jgi:hypothetical protein